MTQQEERQGERMAAASQAFLAEGRQRLEDAAGAQSEFLDRIQNSHRKWLDRIQNEANLAVDFANKLTSARSLTETASLFQSWTAKHMEMASEDARRALSDTQDILAAGARFWTQLGGGNGTGKGH
ncbi:hypothetical protein [Methylocystis echinoides]|uniref:Phasin domain-containing protein n=1 Tax=Methylocystis echinoides TaxID=29468 RepID=A0A9W6GST5_9HYPH|nr:hypothetical protein [Methylocystis echinoides]GLI92206.1 hypothetical protein LMG27198_11980 [Methylocystis echinoides]